MSWIVFAWQTWLSVTVSVRLSCSHIQCISGTGEACITLAPRLAEDSSPHMLHNHHSQKETAAQAAAGSGRHPSHSRLIGQSQSHGHTSLQRAWRSPILLCAWGEGRTEIFLNDIIFNHSDLPHIFTWPTLSPFREYSLQQAPVKDANSCGREVHLSKLKSDDLSTAEDNQIGTHQRELKR